MHTFKVNRVGISGKIHIEGSYLHFIVRIVSKSLQG